MKRHEYRAAYREARKAQRFIRTIKTRFGFYVNSAFEFMNVCPGYDCTRLHGDHLGNSCFGHMGQVTHKARMNYLRDRVRLPA